MTKAFSGTMSSNKNDEQVTSASKMRLRSILMEDEVSYVVGAQSSTNYGGAKSALEKQQAKADSLVQKAEASAKALSRQHDLLQ